MAANNIERAKQFMPFAALRGYYELVREQERVTEPRRELSDEEADILSQRLGHIQKGMVVRVRHYDTDAYVTTQGVVSRICPEFHRLTIIKREIRYEDILSVDATELDALDAAGEREEAMRHGQESFRD